MNSRLHGFMLPLTAPQYTKPDRFESFLDARRWYVVGGAKSEARCAQNANLIKPTLLSCGTMSQEGNTMRTSTRVMTSVPYDLPQLSIMTARLRPPPPPRPPSLLELITAANIPRLLYPSSDYGQPVLCDFGEVRFGRAAFTDAIQPCLGGHS